MTFPFRRLILLALGAGVTALPAAEQRFSSGPTRASLIELYTSEGCSSCPPAEDWLDSLRSDPGLWRQFVPVAFHVDYWDHLGWPDRFATRAFTQRQYAHASAWGSNSVYTPCFVRDGAEWHPSEDLRSRSDSGGGVLTAVIGDDGVCRVRFVPAHAGGDWQVHVALLGGGLSSHVTAGENRGATLHHEFTALALIDAPLTAGAAEVSLPRMNPPGLARKALAVWVTRDGLDPVQATGGWIR